MSVDASVMSRFGEYSIYWLVGQTVLGVVIRVFGFVLVVVGRWFKS